MGARVAPVFCLWDRASVSGGGDAAVAQVRVQGHGRVALRVLGTYHGDEAFADQLARA